MLTPRRRAAAKGTGLSLRAATGVDFDLDVTVERIGREENGRVIVVLRGGSHLAYVTLLRAQNVELILARYEGLRIPKNALRVDADGSSGVYCLVGLRAYRKPVEVLWQGRGLLPCPARRHRNEQRKPAPALHAARRRRGDRLGKRSIRWKGGRMNMSIRENIQQVRENIAAAALRRAQAEDITLVGASKMNDAAACREAIAAGIDALGENRVQEMTQKLAENAYDGAPLHFIGHLQRNKVKQVVGKVALIESVGSYELLEDIDRQAEKLGIVQPILLEVNVGGGGGQERLCRLRVPRRRRKAKSLSTSCCAG